MRMPKEKRFRRAIKLYEVAEVQSMTNVFNRNRCFESGDSPLTLAAQQGHEVIVESLLDAGAHVNRLDDNGRAAIHVACQLNDLPTLKILLVHGADANRLTSDGRTTPLHIAVERGFATVVSELLDTGADVDGLCAGASTTGSTVTGATPLVVAVNNGHVDCADELLQAGADQNIRDARGNSPARLAVLNDDVACVRLLLEQRQGPADAADLLRLSVVSGAGCDVVEALVKSGRCDVEHGGSQSTCRPLMLAAVKGRSDVVDVLLDCRAEVDAEFTDEHDRQPLTALHFAVSAAVDLRCRADYCRRYAGETSCARARQRRRHQQPSDVSSCHGDGYVRCVMSLVQAGADVSGVWRTFVKIFPANTSQPITFQQMVVCEVLTQAYGFSSVSTDDSAAFVARLLQLGEFGLVKLVYSAGVDVSRHHHQQLATSTAHVHDPLTSSMLDYIDRLLHNPRRLNDLCRRQIRRQLAFNVLWLLSQLNIGDSVKDYLCIMDTDHYIDV